MTLEQLLYILTIDKAFNEYTLSVIRKRKYKSNVDRYNDEFKLSLAYIYYEMIIYYYRDTLVSPGVDDNSMTVVEIKAIINTFNDIIGSNICYKTF